MRYQGFSDLALDWERLKQLYLQKAAGPSRMEVLSGWLTAQLLQSAQQLWEDLQAFGPFVGPSWLRCFWMVQLVPEF